MNMTSKTHHPHVSKKYAFIGSLVAAVLVLVAGFTVLQTQASNSTNIIFEDFTDTSSADNFAASGGTWTVSSGTLNLTDPVNVPGSNGNLAIHNQSVSGDYELSTKINVVDTTLNFNDASVFFGFQDASNYYFASFNESNDASTHGIFAVKQGVVTELADFSGTLPTNQFVDVTIVKTGNTYSVMMNGNSLGSVTDSSYSSGKVGLGSRNDSVSFDDFTVSVSGQILRADINLDTTVNIFDLSALLSKWNSSDEIADINADGIVNVFDLSILLSEWGKTGTYVPEPDPTPDPGPEPEPDPGPEPEPDPTPNPEPDPTPDPGTVTRPSEATTGPQSGIALQPSGAITVKTNGAIIENLDVTGIITVQANNVTIRNVKVTSGTSSFAININPGFYGTKVEYAEVFVTAANGAIGGVGDHQCTQGKTAGTNVTVRYSHFHGTADGIKVANCSLYEHNYIKMRRADGSVKHIDGIQASGRSYWTARYNWVDQAYSGGHNAAIFQQAYTGSVDVYCYDVLIEKNWVNGGVYTLNFGNGKNSDTVYLQNVVARDNIIYRDYLYGVFNKKAGVSGNGGYWADTGQVVPTGSIPK